MHIVIKRRYTEVDFDFNLDELENLDMTDFISISSDDRSEADEKNDYWKFVQNVRVLL